MKSKMYMNIPEGPRTLKMRRYMRELSNLALGEEMSVEGRRIKRVSINDDVYILGELYHGLEDIKKQVAVSLCWNSESHWRLCKDNRDSRPFVCVGEVWQPYPCFDVFDSIWENRTYQLYYFRITHVHRDMLRYLVENSTFPNESVVLEDALENIYPLVYYKGDGDSMLVVK